MSHVKKETYPLLRLEGAKRNEAADGVSGLVGLAFILGAGRAVGLALKEEPGRGRGKVVLGLQLGGYSADDLGALGHVGIELKLPFGGQAMDHVRPVVRQQDVDILGRRFLQKRMGFLLGELFGLFISVTAPRRTSPPSAAGNSVPDR